MCKFTTSFIKKFLINKGVTTLKNAANGIAKKMIYHQRHTQTPKHTRIPKHTTNTIITKYTVHIQRVLYKMYEILESDMFIILSFYIIYIVVVHRICMYMS